MSPKWKKRVFPAACAAMLLCGAALLYNWLVCPGDVFIERHLGEVTAIRYTDYAAQETYETDDPAEIAAFLDVMRGYRFCRWWGKESQSDSGRLYIGLTYRSAEGRTESALFTLISPAEMGGVRYKLLDEPSVYDFIPLMHPGK